ncbi:S8 family peptidase [Actinomyces polynesiensis]|uniref:S8 family peptidase n=1 Tax=Actinomyces polynesiensis TaxID=1325934 RepID=UPI0009E2C508|nr:S8 family serine peptidase [Actinomyces polynesiensis]
MKHPHGARTPRVAAAAVALGVLGATALSGVAAASPAATGGQDQARSITADATVSDGQVMNYAVNLLADVSAENFATAVSLVEKAGGTTLEQYPQLGTFFVQSASAGFIGDMANDLARAGIPFDSIGPTRQAPIEGEEVVVDASSTVAKPFSLLLKSNSQLDKEEAISGGLEADPLSASAWGLTAIGALAAQGVDVPLETVTVGVLDTGIDGNHPDLKDQIDVDKSVSCAVNGIPDTSWDAWQDNHYHGTHVAGTIAAATNGTGVDGVAPKARLAAVQTGNPDGFFYPEYVTCAFVWAGDHDFDVTNNSYYTDPWEYWVPGDNTQAAGLEAVTRAVAYSEAKGVVNVAAAGNSNNDLDNLTTDSGSPNDVDTPIKDRDVSDGVDIPAELPGVVTVSSVARQRSSDDPATATLIRSSFSNYGVNSIDVAAPGSSILSTIPTWYSSSAGAGYGSLSGTSMASPHTAGVVALIKAIHPDFTPEQTTALLEKQAGYTFDRLAVPTDGKEYRGAGLVNALAAVLKDQPQPVVGEVEYSTDGGETWSALEGATLQGAVKVRVSVTGPVTAATLSVGGTTLAEGEADGSFDGPGILLEGALDFSDATEAQDLTATVSAEGRNADPEADDDVAADTAFSAEPTPAVEPTPEPSDDGSQSGDDGSAAPTPTPSLTAKPGASPTATDQGGLAATGANLSVLVLAGLALAGGASALVVSRTRSTRH